jgi:hypothetical protein
VLRPELIDRLRLLAMAFVIRAVKDSPRLV